MNIHIVIIIGIAIIVVIYQLNSRNPMIGERVRALFLQHTLAKYVLLYNAIQILLVVIYQNLSKADAFVFTAVFPLFWIICVVLLVRYIVRNMLRYRQQGISTIELLQLCLLTPIPFLWIVRSVGG